MRLPHIPENVCLLHKLIRIPPRPRFRISHSDFAYGTTEQKSNALGDNKTDKKMVTISTTDDKEKTSNCVTPKKKAANSTAAAATASAEAATEQTAPNILVYKKVCRGNRPSDPFSRDFIF